jgi:hypothetical protein
MREAMAALEAEAQAAAAGAGAEEESPAGAPEGPGEGESPPPAPDDKAQRNFTAPDSRIMKTADGSEQAYNAQAAVDADSQVTVSAELTNAANDKQQVEPMVAEIERETGSRPRELSADGGYCSESNLEHLSECGIRGYVATGRQKHGQASAAASKTMHAECAGTGRDREAAIALGLEADLLTARGELDEALRTLQDDALPAFERLGDVRGLLVGRAKVALALLRRGKPGDREEAGRLLRLALEAARKMRLPREVGQIEEIMRETGIGEGSAK